MAKPSRSRTSIEPFTFKHILAAIAGALVEIAKALHRIGDELGADPKREGDADA